MVTMDDVRVVANVPGAGGDAEHMAHVARKLERERIVSIIRERRQQYRIDGWTQIADAMSRLLDEVEKK